MNLKNKKVLLVGLGILGGGVATARFLIENGAILTVTDIKTEEYLKNSIEKLSDFKDKINFVLGEHREKDFLENEIIVINPDVPLDNKFVKIALDAGKQVENELTLFFSFAKVKKIIGITGTRGKTTTTNWTAYILKSFFKDVLVLGNDPEKPFLSEIKNCNTNTVAVLEMPSFQLELFRYSKFAPDVAVITNLYQDHLSRHKTMEGYARAKAGIFVNQIEQDFLILNKENEWTEFFLKQNPKSKVVFSNENNFLNDDEKMNFINKWGKHNFDNLLFASSVSFVLGVPEEKIKESIGSLPNIKWREEKVFENDSLEIYNDTAATSPEATISAIERFINQGKEIILITGGTDRELDFILWGKVVKEKIKKENLVLLSGSATEKMKKELLFDKYNEYDTLNDCFSFALEKSKAKNRESIILFSPGSKSFEKFKNEFDRGEKFNAIVKEYYE